MVDSGDHLQYQVEKATPEVMVESGDHLQFQVEPRSVLDSNSNTAVFHLQDPAQEDAAMLDEESPSIETLLSVHDAIIIAVAKGTVSAYFHCHNCHAHVHPLLCT